MLLCVACMWKLETEVKWHQHGCSIAQNTKCTCIDDAQMIHPGVKPHILNSAHPWYSNNYFGRKSMLTIRHDTSHIRLVFFCLTQMLFLNYGSKQWLFESAKQESVWWKAKYSGFWDALDLVYRFFEHLLGMNDTMYIVRFCRLFVRSYNLHFINMFKICMHSKVIYDPNDPCVRLCLVQDARDSCVIALCIKLYIKFVDPLAITAKVHRELSHLKASVTWYIRHILISHCGWVCSMCEPDKCWCSHLRTDILACGYRCPYPHSFHTTWQSNCMLIPDAIPGCHVCQIPRKDRQQNTPSYYSFKYYQ